MFTIIGAMAELKWSLISERVTPGMKAAQTVVGTEQKIAITTPSRATADERAFPHNCNAKESDNARRSDVAHLYNCQAMRVHRDIAFRAGHLARLCDASNSRW
jgi:hypothetical protein